MIRQNELYPLEQKVEAIQKPLKQVRNRPKGYYYWDQLIDHIGDSSVIFNGDLTYPRQLEIHLPSDHKKACGFDCFYCAGKNFVKDLGTWEMDGLELMQKLKDKIPYHIYGGSYTEPTLNPYFLAYLAMTKRMNCHFGIHTNGSTLLSLEENQGWLTELCRIATDKTDYLSVSLDAGSTLSHCKTKNVKENYFSRILAGIRLATEIRGTKPAIRMCYLMNQFNSSQKEIDRIVAFAESVGVDSLRFSIPFAHYNQSFDVVKRYRNRVEQGYKNVYYKKIEKHLSKDQSDQPFVFWMSPDFQDIDLFDFKECAYGYYQICWGADGYVYRCTTVSTPTFKKLRLGKITNSFTDFKWMIKQNQVRKFDCTECFRNGGRCNRMGLEINQEWRSTHGNSNC
ncbi:MAG: hypothetical protein CW691_01720 [Candidatus Bathyarchaeum sp.]|nr:MAG: hypothetical protein CW691_01720 [Candidatus Bathyarchaeum sp.]